MAFKKTLNVNGAKAKLATAVAIMDRLDTVPSTGPISNAFEVPPPLAPIPSITPLAIAVRIDSKRISTGPMNMPRIAVTMTNAAVKESIPPILSVMLIAMEVVTDRVN